MNCMKIKQDHMIFIYDKENDQTKSNTESPLGSIIPQNDLIYNDNSNISNIKDQYIYIIEHGKVEMNIDNKIHYLHREGIISTKAVIKHTQKKSFLKAKTKKVVLFQLSIEVYSLLFKQYIEECNNEKTMLMQKIYLFNGLDKETLFQIAIDSSKIKILKRKFMFKEDKMPKAIYLITEGVVTCYRGDNVVRKLNKGSVFGEIPLFTQTESMYGYCAEKGTELFRVKYELINKAFASGELFIQKCVSNIFSVAVRNNRILRKYFNEEHYINYLFKIFRMKYYTHEQIASIKNKKLLIPLAGIVYLKTSQTNENYDSHILLNGIAPEHVDKSNISTYYRNGEICGEDLLNDMEDESTTTTTIIQNNNNNNEHNNINNNQDKTTTQHPIKKVWSDECFTFEASWIDILKTIQCSNLIGGNFYSSKSLTLQSLNSLNMMNISTTSMLEKMNYLRKVPYLKSLSEMKIFTLAENLKIIFFKENEVIIRDGPNSDRLYIITQGKAKLIINDIEVKIIEPISHIGDISGMLSSYEQRASFYAKTNITCYYLDKEVYDEVIDSSISNTKIKTSIINNNEHLLTLNDLFYLRDIGQGVYGKVYLVHDQKTKYALKSANIDTFIKHKDAIVHYKEEKNILKIIDHPFIVKLFTTFKTRQYIFLLMEYIEGYTLKQYMDVPLVFKTVRNVTKVTFISAILFSALSYLQRKRIIHRNLKPGNLILHPNGYVKIIDFRIGKDLRDKDSTNTFIGSIHYMAPEMLKGKQYSFSVDIWSIGVIIYELFYGQLPYGIDMKDPQTLLNDIQDKKIYLLNKQQYQHMNNVIKDLLHKNSSKRFNNFNRWKNWELFRDFDINSLLSFNMNSPLLEEGVLPNISMSTSLHEKSKRCSRKKLPMNILGTRVNGNNSNSNNDLENTGYPLHHFIKNISPTSSADLRNNIDNKNSIIDCFNDF